MGLYLLKYPSRRLLAPVARALAWVHPDVLSYLATAVTVPTALCYVWAAQRPGLLLWAVAGTLLRMVLNTLDGVVAALRGQPRLAGEIVNALPDRYSDVILVAAVALSPLCAAPLGMIALASMLLVSYAGMLGKAVGVAWQHHGPMGKVERLICLMAFTLAEYVLLRSGRTGWLIFGLPITPLECCMALFVALGQVTVVKRTRGMLRQIARLEWPRKYAGRPLGRRALVVYDSMTGNTRKVAESIADCLKADLACAHGAPNPRGYDLVVIGSPVVSSQPTVKMQRYLRAHRPLRRYAAFFTYGAPLWGPISFRRALRCLADILDAPPLATFVCKGYHTKLKTYRGRPNDEDVLSAFLFARRLVPLLTEAPAWRSGDGEAARHGRRREPRAAKTQTHKRWSRAGSS